ncbi:REPEAT-CONTAINING PROTEIN putative-RELATED [Salix viminalis]|uniref:REPEAT-CONTAINING PROTEIN putative-RELATED n=1 Tax=Salix viminalis TaxID=40686 RepID=A0A9Q0ZPJ5_SALVM|nr:REPEAT-CONTAINING PROTEIN putative-RELATED [Salix viminalis]
MLKRTIFSKTPTSTLLNISTSSPSANPPYNITTCINASLQQCAINKNLKRGQQTSCPIAHHRPFLLLTLMHHESHQHGFCEVMEVFQVKKIHGLVFKLGLDLDMYVGSSLVSSYLKSELMKDARELFDEMPERDVVLWNSMVNGYAQIGQLDEALRVCREMSQEGVLMSKFTVSGVLSVFSVRGDFANGRLVHGFMIKMGFDSCVSNARSWGVQLDLVTITTILPACSHLAALVHGREIHGYLIVNGFIKDGESENMYNLQSY